jgi:hypothetical protein
MGISDPAFNAEMANVNARMHDGMEIARCGNIDRLARTSPILAYTWV